MLLRNFSENNWKDYVSLPPGLKKSKGFTF